jgi:hypothetical protein
LNAKASSTLTEHLPDFYFLIITDLTTNSLFVTSSVLPPPTSSPPSSAGLTLLNSPYFSSPFSPFTTNDLVSFFVSITEFAQLASLLIAFH